MTVGATLLIVTSSSARLLLALSLSLTWTETVLEFGPSGKTHTKLPAPVVPLKDVDPDCVPDAPQLTATRVKVSSPGSSVRKSYVWLVPSLASPSPDRLTSGATLLIATVWLAVLLRAPAASLTWIVTSVFSGP